MAKKQNLNSFVKQVLRNASFRGWWASQAVFHRVKVDRGQYRCEGCNKIFKQKELEIDHIDPVIDIKLGFTTWDDYIHRLFVEPDKLQALCAVSNADGTKSGCHAVKTQIEANMREFYKKQRKEQNSENIVKKSVAKRKKKV
jgi:hypothetical protein